ncbi:MAG TPA: AsmA family protein [Candidatus Binatia bacterium]
MRKWIVVGAVLFVFCAILVVALLNLNSLINRNKDYFLGQAEQALGRKISVGDVGVTLWGGVGLSLSNFAMADDPTFSSGDFVRAGDLQINVKLLPLLRKDFQVKRLILHKPTIQVIRNTDGRFNFSTIGKEKKEKQKEPQAAERNQEQRIPPALLIGLVDVSDGEVHYVDRKAGTDFRANRIDFKVKDFDLNRPFSTELAAAMFSEKQNFKLQAQIGPIGSHRDFSDVPFDGKADIESLDFGKLKSTLPLVKAALPRDMDLSGIVTVKDLRLKGTLKKLSLKGALDGTGAMLNLGNSLRKVAGIPLVLSTDAQYGNGLLRLGQTKAKLSNLELTGSGDINLGEVSNVNLSFASNRFSLDGWEKIIPLLQNYQLSGNLELQKTTVQGKLGKGVQPQIQGTVALLGVSAKPPEFPKPIKDLDTKIDFTGQRAVLKDTTLSLGNSRIRLAAEIDRFSPLTLSYKLSTPEIWPADFQASLSEDRKADVIKNLNSAGSLSVQDGTVTYRGNLSSTQGTLYKINYKDLGTNLVLENKVASIRNLRLNALSGSLQADGQYAFNSAVPNFSVVSKAQGLDLKELYHTLDPQRTHDIQGRLNADMKVSGSGKEWNEIKPSLRGQGQAEVLQGALLNFNVADNVLSSITGIPGLTSMINPQLRKKYPETFEAKDTRFNELKGLLDVADSRMSIKDLRIATADYTVQGNGWVDFEKRADFQAVLLLSQPLSADLGRSAREVTYLFNKQNQFEVPFSLTGTLPKLKVRPDSNYLGRMVQRGFMRKGVEELQQRLLGKERSSSSGETSPQISPSDQKKDKKKNSTEELIRKGLDQLFRR